MQQTIAPAKRPMPPLSKPNVPTPPTTQASATKVQFASDTPATNRGHRVELYGTGGIGKTTLCCLAEGKTAMIDADESKSILEGQLNAIGAPIPNVVKCNDWKTMLDALNNSGWESIKNIVIDSVTKVEEWCVAHTLKNVRIDRSTVANRIEDYGYGKGYQHVFDTFLPLLVSLDRHIREGRNVFLVAHDCVVNVPNPAGEDYIRYEPRLQSPSSGKASIRLRVKEWSDHVLWLGYDIAAKDRKAQGCNTRTLYTAETPFCMAKSRTTSDQIVINYGEDIWPLIIK